MNEANVPTASGRMTDEQVKAHARQLDEQKAILEPYFNRVANPTDWKARIDAIIPEDDRFLTFQAIQFFTATDATFVRVPSQPGYLRVTSIGYRQGPAGDH